MHPSEFKFLNDVIKSRSGIDLKEDKLYLFESRLLPIASRQGHDNLSSFVSSLMQSQPSETVIQQIIEAMTTNESMFFRDTRPFQWLKDIVFTELLEKRPGQPIRIWCAACSSGQEPYSIAMQAEENRAILKGSNISILATDIDQQIISKAQDGIYNQFEAQRGLPMQLLLKYFTQLEDNRWQLNDTIRQMVMFKQHNLMENATRHGQFDVIFCRNVLIYFDEETKIKVLTNLAEAMSIGSYLFLGSAETLPPGLNQFTPHPEQRMIYVRTS